MQITLFLTPVPIKKFDLEGKTAVVIDVLRLSTTICAMFQSGARGVIPVGGPGEAGEMWTKLGADMAVLAGERNGVRIENFQFGNSPAEFSSEAIDGRSIVTTTTNGSAVFKMVAAAALVVPCAFVNISAVAARIAEEKSDLFVVCAGREGSYSVEDTLCGGMLIDKLSAQYGFAVELNDAAGLALMLYRGNRDSIAEGIANSEHGRYLQGIGFGDDVTLAAQVDAMPIVSVLADGRLVLPSDRN